MALRTAFQSTCLIRKYGAIIVNERGHVIATGYNGAPRKQVDCVQRGFCYRQIKGIQQGCDYSQCTSIHSEANALLQAGRDARGATIYIAGCDATTGQLVDALPCFQCAKMMINAEIELIVYSLADGTIQAITPVDRYAILEADLYDTIYADLDKYSSGICGGASSNLSTAIYN